MIEKDLKEMKKAHKKIDKNIKAVMDWQKQHEKEDNARQVEVTNIIRNLPTTEHITTTIADTIKVVVNGKIDDIKKHLTQQDTLQLEMQTSVSTMKKGIEILSKKVNPLDQARSWLASLVKVLAYMAAVIASISVIAGGFYYLFTLR